MPGGRPSQYDPEIHPTWAWGLAACDMTDAQIADKMGISIRTLQDWKNRHKEFRDALKSGKEPTDQKVKQAFFKRIVGFTYTERRTIMEVDKKTNERKPLRIEQVEKYVPPDPMAAYLWLKNRDPENWKDKPDVPKSIIEFQAKMKGIADLINYPAEDRELPE